MEYDARWRHELETLRWQCILEPPPVPRQTLLSTDVEQYVRLIRPFHRKWGRWWLWLMLFPLLIMILIAKRLEQSYHLCLQWKNLHGQYRKPPLSAFGAVICFVIHFCLRMGLNSLMLLPDLYQLMRRKAIWREKNRYALLDKRDDAITLKLVAWSTGLKNGLRKARNRIPTLDKGPTDKQYAHATLFTLSFGIMVYYAVMLSITHEAGLFTAIIGATILFFWPVPIGIVWMVFLFTLAQPFIARIFYSQEFWNRQYPSGFFGEPASDRRYLWYSIAIGTIAMWIFI